MTSKELARFWKKVRVTPFGCWAWLAGQNEKGYANFRCGGKQKRGHRVAYQYFIGPIPKGRQIDHLCRNRACVNPQHMEIVTPRENTIRGIGPTAKNARKTHCKHGHEFTEENTRIVYHKDGGPRRSCRECDAPRAKQVLCGHPAPVLGGAF